MRPHDLRIEGYHAVLVEVLKLKQLQSPGDFRIAWHTDCNCNAWVT